jgi:hypothetical protein
MGLPVAALYWSATSRKFSQSPSNSAATLTVARQTRGLEQVGPEADALRADVGAEAHEASVTVGRGLFLPVEPAALHRVGCLGEKVGVLHRLGEPVDLHGLDVGETLLAELREVVAAGVGGLGGTGVLDRDVRVLIHVLLEEFIGVAEVVERGNGERDLLIGVGGRRFAAAARAAGEHDGRGREGCDRSGAPAEGT